MKQVFTGSNKWIFVFLAALFAAVVWQAVALPVTAAEAAAWGRFVRPRFSELVTAPGSWSGLLYGLVAKRTVGLFRLSEFSLRLPDVLAGGIYLGSFGSFLRRRWLLAPLAAVPVFLDYFSLAGGLGIALGFCALALRFPKQGGVWLGLALAAAPQFGFVPGIVAAGLVAVNGFWVGMERIVVPAVALGFMILVIPLSHGGPPAPTTAGATSADTSCRAAVEMLRSQTGNEPVAIRASPDARPILEFYRERYRRRNWLLDGSDPQYFLWFDSGPAAGLPARPVVLFHRDGVVLAR